MARLLLRRDRAVEVAIMSLNASLPLTVVLGSNEIASAVAVFLRDAGWGAILIHDPFPPVIRRGMAFHDVLFGDRRVIGNIEGVQTDSVREIEAALAAPDWVAITASLQLSDLLAIGPIAALVDARMQKHRAAPNHRGVARVVVGLGPHFCVGVNCDVAVETRPTRSGQVVTAGSTDLADGIASRLGGAGSERFVYSDRAGRWHTAVEIGTRVFSRFIVGHLDGRPVYAPLDGTLRGIVRDGLQVPAGVKLVEIDPRGREARWSGIDDRGRSIAAATVKAVGIKLRRAATANRFDATVPA
jgi:xanthine dehydrogenase accessory factor